MRVAIISEWYSPRAGGIEVFLADLTARMQADGIDIDVLTPTPGPAEVGGVPVIRLCDMSRENGGYRFPPAASASNGQDFLFQLSLYLGRRPRALARLRAALQGGRYDVAHVHMGNTPFTYLAVNLCIALGLPVVATFHAMLTPLEKPLFGVAARLLGCDRWAGRVVLSAVSSAAADARRIMFGRAGFTILPNGIDPAIWTAVREDRAQRPANQRLELVSALRLHPRKRPLALLDAIATLPAETAFRLRIAGDGPQRDALARRIEAGNLRGKVELCGQVPREVLACMLAEADLFVMPTRHESFGIAVLEARGAGLPVLAMQSSGARDFLVSGTDSLLARNDRAFAAELRRFALNAPLRARLAAGAAQPLTGYGWSDVLARCRAAYAKATPLAVR